MLRSPSGIMRLSYSTLLFIALLTFTLLWNLYWSIVGVYNSPRSSSSSSMMESSYFIIHHNDNETKQETTKHQHNNNNHSTHDGDDCFTPNPYIIINRHRNTFINLTHTTTPSPPNIKLPYPAIVIGFPKSGTTSIDHLFHFSGIKTRHYDCRPHRYCGVCFREAIKKRQKPLAYCGGDDDGVRVWTQLDYSNYIPGHLKATIKSNNCYWPQIESLDEIHEESPNATFILNFRSSFENWLRSVSRNGDMVSRISRCSFFNQSRQGRQLTSSSSSSKEEEEEEDQFKMLFCHHVTRIRQFVARHPSHALVEINVEDPLAGWYLARVFEGVNESYWGHYNKNPIKKKSSQ